MKGELLVYLRCIEMECGTSQGVREADPPALCFSSQYQECPHGGAEADGRS